MARGILGMTDYSHQSLDDIKEDLIDYSSSIEDCITTIENRKVSIENYWVHSVPNNFKHIFNYSVKFFHTSKEEIDDILQNIQVEVQENHCKRLTSLSNTAQRINENIGQNWHNDYPNQEFGDKDFRKVERIYGEIRDLACTLVDTSNMAGRLTNFIGKKGSIKSSELSLETDFVNKERIDELKMIKSDKFDLIRLIKFCEELNIAHKNACYLSVGILVRAIIDHIPPIFSVDTFTKLANNCTGSKSFKYSMKHLDESARKIGDSFLHTHIRNKEILPNFTQVNCTQDLDVLLSEICRLLK